MDPDFWADLIKEFMLVKKRVYQKKFKTMTVI
jgi:hypothetical protein